MSGKQFLKATPQQIGAMIRFLDIRDYSDAYIDDLLQWVQNGDRNSLTPGQVVGGMQVAGRPR